MAHVLSLEKIPPKKDRNIPIRALFPKEARRKPGKKHLPLLTTITQR
jgi:hypothetical protein